MSEGPRLTTVGVAGGVNINADLSPMQHAVAIKVQLSANYTPAYPAGYPTPPFQTGVSQAALKPGGTILTGTQVLLHAHEANALVAAGKATLV